MKKTLFTIRSKSFGLSTLVTLALGKLALGKMGKIELGTMEGWL